MAKKKEILPLGELYLRIQGEVAVINAAMKLEDAEGLRAHRVALAELLPQFEASYRDSPLDSERVVKIHSIAPQLIELVNMLLHVTSKALSTNIKVVK